MSVTPGMVIGSGTILSKQDSFSANVAAAVVGGVASYSGSLTFSDSKAGDTFTAVSITSVQLNESPVVTGPTTTNGYFTITGTATLNGGTSAVYNFTASGSLPFPANAGSTGGVGFTATGPNGFSYNTPWNHWDPGQTVAITITQPVLVPTTTHLTSSANPSVYRQPVTFTATVTPGLTGYGAVGGYVAFTVDGNTPVDEPITNGQAVYETTSLGVGTHKVVASYLGTSVFAPSQDTIASQVVNQASSTTTLGYSGSFVPGLPLTLTATVAAQAPSYDYPTGSVTFRDGTTTLGKVNLSGTGTSQTVSLPLPTGLALGAHSLTAVYSGDANTVGSTSAVLSKTVAQATTETSLMTTVNPVVIGNPVTLTATVYGSSTAGGAKPTGSVTFYDGTTKLSTVPLTVGVAQLMTSFSTPGYHALQAVYSGDTSFVTSTGTLTQSIVMAPTAPHISLSSSANPVIFGLPVTITVSVSGGATGTVTLLDGGKTALGTATLTQGSATFKLSSLSVGQHVLTASFSGDPNFTAGTSSSLTETVSLPTPSMITGKGTTQSGQDSFNVNVVTAVTGGVPSYSGMLTFSDSKAGDTFTAVSISSVQIYESPQVTGPTGINGYFIISGTAKLNGGTALYNFTATASLPFPANAGSTGGLEFQASGPNGVVYSTPWAPWDSGETIVVTILA
jgi:hypothetical protein